jgi:serine/threonine protein kinase
MEPYKGSPAAEEQRAVSDSPNRDLPAAIGPYRILERLGEGGMGTVYLGTDDSDRKVAIKVIRKEHAADPMYRARFESEVSAAQRVRPFCTAPVLDADPNADPPYLVTEFVSGSSLQQAAPLRGADLEALAVGMATALTAIHDAGIVHRDLKPANVLLSPYGPRVIDFGIARAVDSVRLTATGGVIGTPAFMSPEQLDGRDVGPASDVFAWGATLAFAASGAPCFDGSTLPIMHQILHGEPNLRGLDGPLLAVVRATLDKDPASRPTAQQLVERLVSSRAPSAPEVPPPRAPDSSPEPAPEPAPEVSAEPRPAQPPSPRPEHSPPPAPPASRPPVEAGQQSHPRPSMGPGTPEDSAALVEQQYRMAAEAGDTAAMYNLGVLLSWRGRHDEAMYWYRRAAASQSYPARPHGAYSPHSPQYRTPRSEPLDQPYRSAYHPSSHLSTHPSGHPSSLPSGHRSGAYRPHPTANVHSQAGTNSTAVAALVLGLVGLLSCGLPSIPAIIMGHVAWSKVKRSGERGAGMAAAGIAMGWIMIALWAFVLLALALDSVNALD